MAKTQRLTMAQALVQFLTAQYLLVDGQSQRFVQGIMGIFGHGNVTGLGEALEYGGADLPFYQGHNEQGMAHAAIAFAKQKNRQAILACTSSIGPGATNMVTAAATATTNRIPLLLLPGDIFASRGPDPVLQQLEAAHDGSLSVNDCFKPISVYWDRLYRPEQLMPAMLQAMRLLTDPAQTGAVTICLPQDVQAEAYDYPDAFFAPRTWAIRRPAPDQALLQAVAARLKAAQRPMIIAGGGIHYAQASQQLADFASRYQIPVAETQAGKSALPASHPFNLGGMGVTGSQAANRLAAVADCLLVIGSRLQDFTTASRTAFKHPEAQLIHINVNGLDASKLDGLAVQADAGLALAELSDCLADYVVKAAWSAEVQQQRQVWERVLATQLEPVMHHGRLSQKAVLGLVNQQARAEDVVIGAAGSLPGDLHRLWQSRAAKDYHVEYAYSCMGYEVAAGLGVRLAKADAVGEVYVAVGDGSFLMMHSELLTALQEGLKMTILLFNNGGYQCIRRLQMAHGSQGFGNEFRRRQSQSGQLDGEYLAIDFCQYAAALGATTIKVADYHQLSAALETARQASRAVLIEIPVDKDSMSPGFDSFWEVGIAQVSNSAAVQAAYLQQCDLKKERSS